MPDKRQKPPVLFGWTHHAQDNNDVPAEALIEGTRIATPHGPRLIESLMPGEMICTDNGPQPLIHVTATQMATDDGADVTHILLGFDQTQTIRAQGIAVTIHTADALGLLDQAA